MFRIAFYQFLYKSMAVLFLLAFVLGAEGAGTVYAAPKIPTTTSLSFSTSPAAGVPLTVTAIVAPSSAIGMVTFTATLGRMRITLPASCATAPVTGGSASCTFTPASAGTYTFSAKFTDTKVYASSTGSRSIVVKLATSTMLSFSASPTIGSPVTVTATVAPAATGTVAFTASIAGNAVALPAGCASTAISGGRASCTFTPAAVATYNFTATSSGDSIYTGSTGSGSVWVARRATQTSIWFSTSPTVGSPVTVTATVTPAAATGTVAFRLNGLRIPASCFVVTLVSGSATCTFIPEGTFPYEFTASYSGDASYEASQGSGSVSSRIATQTSLFASGYPTVDYPITITAMISPAATGTVDFTATFANDSVALPASCTSVAIGSARATCTFTPSAPGVYSFTAAYSGNTDYLPSSGNAQATVLSGIPTTTVVTDNATTIPGGPAPVAFGGAIVFTATINSANGTTPTGTVQWMLTHDGPDYAASGSGIAGACLGDVPVVDGVATCSVTPGYYWDSGNGIEASFQWGIRATATFTAAAESGFVSSSGSDSTNKIRTRDYLSCYIGGELIADIYCIQNPFTPVSIPPGTSVTVAGEAVDSLARNLVYFMCSPLGCAWSNTPSVTFADPSNIFTMGMQVVCPEGVNLDAYTQSFECDYLNLFATFKNEYQGE